MRTLISFFFARLGPAVALLAALVVPRFFAAESAADPVVAHPADLHLLDYSGSQLALETVDREIAAAGHDRAKLTAIESHLLGELGKSDVTFAARQAICSRLGLLLVAGPDRKESDSALAALVKLLTSDRDVDLARLALEPVPGETVDALFLQALEKSTGRSRIALIQSIGVRRLAPAVPRLASLVKDSDAQTAAAAVKSLGLIGGPAALAGLGGAADQIATGVVEAKLTLAPRLSAAEAGPVLRDILAELRVALPLRAAALRVQLEIEPAAAPARIIEVLGGQDWEYKKVAIEAIASFAGGSIVPPLAAKLAAWDEPTQIAVIAAFGRKGDTAAIPAISAATAHASADVRAAAITALGILPGTPETASVLVQLTISSKADDAKLARQSLARLNGPGVSAAILSGAERGEPVLRSAYIAQLALRNMAEGLPMLLKCRIEPDASVRTAALAALGDLAPASEQRALLDWTIGATDPTEQSRAVRSLVDVTLRNPDSAARALPIYGVIEHAGPASCVRLLPVLSRLGGTASAECAARIAVRKEPTSADAAAATLTHWPDGTALLSLVSVAEKAVLPAPRKTAAEGVIDYLERNREPWSSNLSDVLARSFAAIRDDDLRKRLGSILNRANDDRTLSLAEGLQSDPLLATTAKDAAATIRSNLTGPPTIRASASAGQVKNLTDGDVSTRWTVPATADQWLEIDFRNPRPVRQVTLDETGRTGDFPEHYEIFVTDDAKKPGTAAATGAGKRNKTVIDLPAGTQGRYVIIKHTAERKDSSWTISELFVD